MEAPLYNQEGFEVGTITLPEKLFGARWNPELVKQVVWMMQSSRRAGTAHSKGRGEVSGGGKKPWRQKGTGRARHGSTRSPIWVGGGVTHGPTSDKKYGKKINIKTRRKALAAVLSRKIKDEEIIFLDKILLSDAKTKTAASMLKKIGGSLDKKTLGARGGRTLVVLEDPNTQAIRALRNLPFVTVEESRNINAEKALTPKFLIMTKHAIEKIIV